MEFTHLRKLYVVTEGVADLVTEERKNGSDQLSEHDKCRCTYRPLVFDVWRR